jgi:hypothetical protein
MTPYYTDEKLPFYVNGKLMYMTELEAEDYQEANPEADVQAAEVTKEPKVARVTSDTIDCTCVDEYDICPECQAYFEEIASEV